MAMKNRIPETFRCHVMIKGERCPCDLTMANMFTYSLGTLDRKVVEPGEAAIVETLSANAICPWHARYFARFRKDIMRMDQVVSLLVRREKKARASAERAESFQQRDTRFRNVCLARMPSLGAALISAGVRSLHV